MPAKAQSAYGEKPLGGGIFLKYAAPQRMHGMAGRLRLSRIRLGGLLVQSGAVLDLAQGPVSTCSGFADARRQKSSRLRPPIRLYLPRQLLPQLYWYWLV